MTSTAADRHLRSGLWAMVGSSTFFSVMFISAYAAARHEQGLSSFAVSAMRIGVNLPFVIALSLWNGRGIRSLFGDYSGALWWRGVFGGLNIIVIFFAIQAIGIGEASFLAAGSGPLVAIAAPFVLGQKNRGLTWLAIGGALVGLYLLFEPRFTDGHPWGRAIALFSGVLAAGAYLMVARAGTRNTSESVVFYFCLVGVLIHIALYAIFPWPWPVSATAWALMVFSGISGSIAQQFMTVGYQRAPAASAAAINYLTPVLNLLLGAALFRLYPDPRATLGATLVLLFGVLLPFWRLPTKKKAGPTQVPDQPQGIV